MDSLAATRVRIFSQLTKTRFLHIEDALEREKLRFFMDSFEKGHGASGTAYAFMDVSDARVILADLAWSKPVDFSDYKGGKSSHELIISRVLKIKTKEDRVWIQVQNGPGESMGDGAIKPKGKPAAEISFPFTVFESRKLAHTCLAYLTAWDLKRMLSISQVNHV